jgi:hypothetical protein
MVLKVNEEYIYEPLRRKVRVRYVTPAGIPERWAVLELTNPLSKNDKLPINVPQGLWLTDIERISPPTGEGETIDDDTAEG